MAWFHYAISVPVSVLPALGLLWFFRRLDRTRPVPRRALYITVALGALACVPAACIEWAEHALLGDAALMGGRFVDAFLVAAFTEESLKLLIVLAYALRRSVFDEVIDGVLYTVAASLGFGLLENMMFAATDVGTGIARALTVVPMHAVAAGVMGYFVGRARFANATSVLPLALAGLFFAVLIHGSYDWAVFNHDSMWAVEATSVLVVSAAVLARMTRRAALLDDLMFGRRSITAILRSTSRRNTQRRSPHRPFSRGHRRPTPRPRCNVCSIARPSHARDGGPGRDGVRATNSCECNETQDRSASRVRHEAVAQAIAMEVTPSSECTPRVTQATAARGWDRSSDATSASNGRVSIRRRCRHVEHSSGGRPRDASRPRPSPADSLASARARRSGEDAVAPMETCTPSSEPADAAHSHAANCVGSRPPVHAQYRCAMSKLTLTAGRSGRSCTVRRGSTTRSHSPASEQRVYACRLTSVRSIQNGLTVTYRPATPMRNVPPPAHTAPAGRHHPRAPKTLATRGARSSLGRWARPVRTTGRTGARILIAVPALAWPATVDAIGRALSPVFTSARRAAPPRHDHSGSAAGGRALACPATRSLAGRATTPRVRHGQQSRCTDVGGCGLRFGPRIVVAIAD